MGAHQTHPVNIEQICSFGAWRYGDYTGYVEQSWIKRLGLCWNTKLSLEETKVPELKKRWGVVLGMYAGFWSPALPTMEGPDSSGSLTSYLPAASICSAVAEDGGRRQNRAAYCDNNMVYIGDSCKPSATVLKPCRAMYELSLACSDHEWVYPPAPASCMAFHASKSEYLNAELFL